MPAKNNSDNESAKRKTAAPIMGGFFAENFREYLHDKRATNENMQSLIEDLKSDTTMFSSVLTLNKYSASMIDTLVDMLDNKSTNTAHIYFLARNL